jgi:serine/threonine protein kinase
MSCHNESDVSVKIQSQNYISHIIKLLTLTNRNNSKILPVEAVFCDLEDKLNKCDAAFTDGDECSTVALSSNPSSFSSIESFGEEDDGVYYPNNFKMLSVLGSGSFGTVYLAEYENQKKEKQVYAVKRLMKIKIHESQMAQIMSEKQILMSISDPFILRLHGTCQTNDELYFVTEALEHGDLYSAIYCGDKLIHEETVFYAACIILGLEFIHSKKVVYRDLKPENIMIGSNGYLKIIDFGLAKQLPYMKLSEDKTLRKYTKCNTLCGTPEYVAPEIIMGNSYDGAVDIWALGVIVYEMITRRTPFMVKQKDADYITQMFTNIVLACKHGIEVDVKLDRKTDRTPNARNLITQLLNGKPDRRVGRNKTPKSLLQHPYFTSLSMNPDDLYSQTYPAPILQPPFIGTDIETAKDVEKYEGDQDIFKEF